MNPWRWPTRIRLTATFTMLMALVLLGVGFATVAHTRSSLDASITEALTYRLSDLQPIAATATPVLSGVSRDTGEQVLDLTGRLVAASPEVPDWPLLAPADLASAQHGRLLVDHATAGTLDGPVRIGATATGDGSRIAVVAVTLSDRDAAVADLRQELLIGFPLVLLAAAVGAYLLAAAALRPVERMRARAATITAEAPDQRLPVPAARDEISRLDHRTRTRVAPAPRRTRADRRARLGPGGNRATVPPGARPPAAGPHRPGQYPRPLARGRRGAAGTGIGDRPLPHQHG